MPTLAEIHHAKKKLALRIAESINEEWPDLSREGYDIDEAAALVELELPMTLAEASAEMAWTREPDDEPVKPRGPSLIRQLGEALHFSEGATIKQILEKAIEKLKD